MRCPDAREAMLVADRSTLRGGDDSTLARHIRECDDCRALAMSIETETDVLASAVALRGPITEMILSERGHRRAAVAITALPIAATIVLGAVLRARGDIASAVQPVELRADTRVGMNVVSVDVSPGQTATVIRTKDPKVTIVWISSGGTQ